MTDDLTAEELDAIRAFVEGDGSLPELADLPAWWDGTKPSNRHRLVVSYHNFAFTKRWAWDGLNRLLVRFLERPGEHLPSALTFWSATVTARMWEGTLKIPPKPRNPRFAAQDDRDFRIMRVVQVLREDMPREVAIATVAGALGMRESTVKSVVEKMESFRPFPRTIRRP